jgi:dolichyl-phosphate-mannose-protein mannosyltransferase
MRFTQQYSQYVGNAAATPQKSAASLTTIGGEPGGRAPIVIEDNAAERGKDAPLAEDPTSAIGVKAEPGRDIFAGERNYDAGMSSSASTLPPQHRPPVEKVISEVNTVQQSMSLQESKKETEAESRKEEEEERSSQTRSEGPLREPEAAADRVAKELYPDAAKA